MPTVPIEQFLTFVLVLARTSGLVMGAPIFGTPDIPVRVRALLAVALALLLTPTQIGQPLPEFPTLVQLVVKIGGELLIGVTLGLGVMLLFSGIQLAGQLISQVSGMSLADVVNPALGTSVPLFSQLLFMISMVVFVSIGGHRQVVAGLLDTFQTIPLGGVVITGSVHEPALVLLQESFELGMRTAAPTVVAQLLATLVMGLVSRTMPQLNIMAVGFGVNSMVTFGAMSLTLGGLAWAFQQQLTPHLEQLLDMIHGLGGAA